MGYIRRPTVRRPWDWRDKDGRGCGREGGSGRTWLWPGCRGKREEESNTPLGCGSE